MYLWCGNAGLLIPPDLESGEWIDRYLEEQTPGYVIVNADPSFAAFADAPRLELVATQAGRTLYRVRDAAPASRPWVAPPPLAQLDAAPEVR